MSNWEHFTTATDCPTTPGVYVFIHDNGFAYYVGSTANLRQRIQCHRRNTRRAHFRDCRVMFKRSRRMGDWLMDEYRLIHRLMPPGNHAGVVYGV